MEARGEARLSEIGSSAETLCRLLQECANSAKPDQPCFSNADWCSVSAFSPETLTPFSELCGPQQHGTVIVGQQREEIHNEPPADTDTVLEESYDRSHELTPPPCLPFSLVSTTEVKIGQPLPSCRVYLTGTAPLHAQDGNHDYKTVQKSVTAHDLGVSPLPLDRARWLCSLYALGSKVILPLPTMWVLCQGDKDQSSQIIALGCSRDNSQLHTLWITGEKCPVKLPHGGGRWGRSTKGEGWAFSSYDITGCSSDGAGASASAGHIEAQFAWSQPECLLAAPPESSDAVLKVSASPGYIFSPILPVFQELTCLLQLCSIEAGVADWPGHSCEQPIASDSTAVRMDSFLESMSSPFAPPLDTTLPSPTADQEVYQPRQDLDTLERLWLFLREVASLSELQELMALFFKAVLLGRAQPLVHKSNTSTLASLLRKALLCSTQAERQALAPQFQLILSGRKLLTALVEVALEKMNADYRNFFIKADLLTGSQLDGFLSGGGVGLLERCHSLCRLHCVFEVAVSALFFLSLPTSTLSTLTKAALHHYQEAHFDGFTVTPTFCLPLPAYSTALKSLSGLCARLAPTHFLLSAPQASGNSLTLVSNHKLYKTAQGASEADTDECFHVYAASCVSVHS